MDIPKLKVINNGIEMDNHLLVPPFFSIWKRWPHLRGRSIVIGFIGPRGSGKSTNAVRTLILDYLMKGRRVWSDNLPIAVDLVLGDSVAPLRSIPMESDFKFGDCFNGCIFMDEINEGDGDSYRSMSSRALELSYDLQELRKGNDGGLSKMDVIWTTQSEMFNMPRIRFQTDIIIKCSDLSLSKKKVGIGEFSRWEIWDYSGMVSGTNVSKKMTEAPVIYTKPWWHTFKTGTKKREEQRVRIENAQTELYQTASKIAKYIIDGDESGTLKEAVWVKWGIREFQNKRSISQLLAENWGILTDAGCRKFKVYDDLVDREEAVTVLR